MPELRCPIINLEFLRDTKERKVYVPKYVHLVVRPCPEPPTQLEVTLDLIQFIEANYFNMSDVEQQNYQKLVYHLHKRQANRQWLLNVQANITAGGQYYFNKNYRPPKQERQRIEHQIDNSNGFFSNLPVSKNKRPSKKVLALIEPRSVREERNY